MFVSDDTRDAYRFVVGLITYGRSFIIADKQLVFFGKRFHCPCSVSWPELVLFRVEHSFVPLCSEKSPRFPICFLHIDCRRVNAHDNHLFDNCR